MNIMRKSLYLLFVGGCMRVKVDDCMYAAVAKFADAEGLTVNEAFTHLAWEGMKTKIDVSILDAHGLTVDDCLR